MDDDLSACRIAHLITESPLECHVYRNMCIPNMTELVSGTSKWGGVQANTRELCPLGVYTLPLLCPSLIPRFIGLLQGHTTSSQTLFTSTLALHSLSSAAVHYVLDRAHEHMNKGSLNYTCTSAAETTIGHRMDIPV